MVFHVDDGSVIERETQTVPRACDPVVGFRGPFKCLDGRFGVVVEIFA
jgi:hypothetical protein